MKVEGGLDAARQALRYWQRRQEVAANNLANVDTPGFKGERVFSRLLADGTTEASTTTDFTEGTIKETGRPLDVAVSGGEFLTVETPLGQRLTRGGTLSLDASGRIVDEAGHVVEGEHGPITVPPGKVQIDEDGTVRVDGSEVGRLRVVQPGAATTLQHEGGGLYRAQGAVERVAPGDRKIEQGRLEESNVSAIHGLVDMIDIQRSFAAVQSSMRVLDGVLGTIANEIGKGA